MLHGEGKIAVSFGHLSSYLSIWVSTYLSIWVSVYLSGYLSG